MSCLHGVSLLGVWLVLCLFPCKVFGRIILVDSTHVKAHWTPVEDRDSVYYRVIVQNVNPYRTVVTTNIIVADTTVWLPIPQVGISILAVSALDVAGNESERMWGNDPSNGYGMFTVRRRIKCILRGLGIN